jgi:predicted DCC family thiol-disulfide oxidoreductase YuxK
MNPRHDWNDFWFRPVSSAPLGLFRIAFGALVLLYGLLLFPDRELWFTDRGIITQAAADAYNSVHVPGPLVSLLHGVNDPRLLLLFFVVFLAAALCLTLGCWTRWATFLVCIGLLSLHNRNHVINSGADAVMMVMAVYLLFAPAGAACSVDRLHRFLRGEEDDEPPCVLPWAMRLMQIQVAVLYLCTFLNKWPGSRWQDGTAIYWALSIPDLRRFPVPLLDAQHLWLVNLATYSTLATELALATLIWVPRLRLYVLAAGVLLHLGIEYSMNIPLFSFLMIASYLVFLRESDLQHFLAWIQEPLTPARVRFVWDGQCIFCRSSLLVVRYLDVFRLVTFINCHDPAALRLVPGVQEEEVEQAAIAVNQRGRRFVGFEAFRMLAWRLPALWFLAPFLYIPGVPWLGRRIYRWVARNRSRLPVARRYAKGSSQADKARATVP